MHILKVHEAREMEVVFNLEIILRAWTEKMGAQAKTKLQHFQDDVLTITVAVQQNRKVMALDTRTGVPPQRRILATRNVPFGNEMVFRNDANHLLVGRRQNDPDSDCEWDFLVYRFAHQGRVAQEAKRLCKIPSFESRSEIGITLVLELLDGYFWVMTSEITPDREDRDSVSYYGGYRYALDEPERPPRYWRFRRRRQNEGPIHDHWTTLSLKKDEGGQYVIAESRKEWLAQHPDTALRSFYTMTFDPSQRTEDEVDLEQQETEVAQVRERVENENKDPENDLPDDETEYVGTLLKFLPSHLFAPWPHSQRSSHHEYPSQAPASLHPRPNSAPAKVFSLSNTPYRTYDASTGTFIEMVNDPELGSESSINLHVRSGNKGSDIKLWPPPGSSCPASLRPSLQPRTLNYFRAIADERCLIFGSCTGRNAPIVLVSYDANMLFGSKLETQRNALYGSVTLPDTEQAQMTWGAYRAVSRRQGLGDDMPRSPARADTYKAPVEEYPALWTAGVVWWRPGPRMSSGA